MVIMIKESTKKTIVADKAPPAIGPCRAGMGRFDGKVVLVTGLSRNCGLESAEIGGA